MITGIAGFVGSHLATALSGKAEVWGTHLDGDISNLDGIDGVNLLKCDLTDAVRVMEVMDEVRPDVIVHLAAQSVPAHSVNSPAPTLNTNIFSTLNILESAAQICPEAVILNVGSCEEYGDIRPGTVPLVETAELRPTNPYAVSKVAQDMLGFQYWKSKGLKVVRCRPFNLFGPRQSPVFVASSFAKQIAEIEAGIKKERVMRVGNLGATRDFLYVRDAVSAYCLLSEKGVYGEAYNICSGVPLMIREIAHTLLSFSKIKIEMIEDSALVRASETKVVYGDGAKLRALGWSPRCAIEEGLGALLDFWRVRLGGRP